MNRSSSPVDSPASSLLSFDSHGGYPAEVKLGRHFGLVESNTRTKTKTSKCARLEQSGPTKNCTEPVVQEQTPVPPSLHLEDGSTRWSLNNGIARAASPQSGPSIRGRSQSRGRGDTGAQRRQSRVDLCGDLMTRRTTMRCSDEEVKPFLGGSDVLPNMRMHLPKPRAPLSSAGRYPRASSQVIRGR